jgi:hypothetical protein
MNIFHYIAISCLGAVMLPAVGFAVLAGIGWVVKRLKSK